MTEAVPAVAERLLGEAWGGDVRLGSAVTLSEGKAYRFTVETAPVDAPARVIVKTARSEPGLPADPDARAGNPAQPLLEEWAGLAFLNSVLPDNGLVPAFYGGDRAACVVAMEDLGAGESLVDALRGPDPGRAGESLTMHAQAIADLHTGTAGAEARYWEVRDALGPRGLPRDWKSWGNLLDTQGWGDLRLLETQLRKGLSLLGQEVPAAFRDEYEALTGSVEHASPFRAYVHSDTCPDNALLGPAGVRLIDFERGGYHLCLLDTAYYRLGMPHCYWAGRLPREVIAETERAYRARLGIAGDFGAALTEACAYWIISNGIWPRAFADFPWGSSTWRARVLHQLTAFAETTEEFGHLTAMGSAARETVRLVRSCGGAAELPLFPAFR
ncbi:hypothetical protein [Amycolatopsis jejuensis]|uniref:hypothetical protein n=1 Tax=Amycolatopsis jejuensis TaxID=330084 RepID=UPI000527E8DF|nr:hypothetical protein [Amycolatopsis jejuensis]